MNRKELIIRGAARVLGIVLLVWGAIRYFGDKSETEVVEMERNNVEEAAGVSDDAETLLSETSGNVSGDAGVSADRERRPGSNDNDPNLKGYRYKYDKSSVYEDGLFNNEPDYIALPCKLKGKEEQLLFRKGYAVSYNKSTKQANWVAWHLTRSHTDGKEERPQRAFHDDDDVPNSTHYYDYNKARKYDRGHMCPAGDNKWDRDAMMESFLMTNVCPQYRNLNSGVWNDIEIKCREWAETEGDVYIVCGPVFFSNRSNREYIGESRIPVPDAFFKVVMSNRNRGKGIGFLCENRSGSADLNDYVCSIDDIEKIVGMDFFPALPDDVEERIEREVGRFK